MKKSLIALAALGAFAGAASAQSSVTLFGIVDTGGRIVKNGDGRRAFSLTNNGLATSRLGFRGEEDLGGGLKAGFWLETTVGLDTGTSGSTGFSPVAVGGIAGLNTTGPAQGAKFFDRRATVGLMGPFGEVRLGRDYTPTFSNLAAFDIYGAVGVGNILNLVNPSAGVVTGTLGSGAGTLVRADNSVAYWLPRNIGGVYGTVMAAAGEGNNNNAAGSTNGNNRYVGGRVGWAGGPVDVAGAYARTKVPGSVDDFRTWNIGASFTIPFVKVTALYHRAEYQPAATVAERRQSLWALGVNVPVGQAEIRATYQRSDLRGSSAFAGLRDQDDARQYAVGAIYNLSKRTALYADVGRLQNYGQSVLTIPGGTLNGAGFPTAASSGVVTAGQDASRRSTALAIGVRHSF